MKGVICGCIYGPRSKRSLVSYETPSCPPGERIIFVFQMQSKQLDPEYMAQEATDNALDQGQCLGAAQEHEHRRCICLTCTLHQSIIKSWWCNFKRNMLHQVSESSLMRRLWCFDVTLGLKQPCNMKMNNETTGLQPNEMLFGRAGRKPIEVCIYEIHGLWKVENLIIRPMCLSQHLGTWA